MENKLISLQTRIVEKKNNNIAARHWGEVALTGNLFSSAGLSASGHLQTSASLFANLAF